VEPATPSDPDIDADPRHFFYMGVTFAF